MSEGNDAGTSTGSESGQGGTDGGQQQTNDNGQQQSGGAWTPPSTAEEFNKVIADRLARQKAQFDKKYAGFDDIAAKAAEFDKAEESRKTEMEKLQDRNKAAEARAATATNRAVRAEIKALATGEFADPTDAYLYLGSDLSKYVNKDGDVDSAALESALKDIGKAKPHLLTHARTDVGVGARGGDAPTSMNDLIRRAAVKRRG